MPLFVSGRIAALDAAAPAPWPAFDPDGEYVRRYVRELADVPAPRIFAPWKDAALLESRGYPEPVLPGRDDERPAQATLPSTRACPRAWAGPLYSASRSPSWRALLTAKSR